MLIQIFTITRVPEDNEQDEIALTNESWSEDKVVCESGRDSAYATYQVLKHTHLRGISVVNNRNPC